MHVGVDVGGTFTDFVAFRGREVLAHKVPTTLDPSVAVAEGMRTLGGRELSHGTTVATNAVLQRRGARTAFVTTAGFEDLLTIGRQDRPSLYDLRITRPEPPVPRALCFGLRERLDARGRVLRAPSRREVERVARAVRRTAAESVAISLLFSFRTPKHERLLAKAFAGLPISMSHQVLPEFREYERSCTTVLDAYIKPLVGDYLRRIETAIGGGFDVMKSSGGLSAHESVKQRPVDLLLSGPAGGVAAAASLARRLGTGDWVTFDMGGTSADFSILRRAQPIWTTDARIDTFPLAIPVIDIESVGAGGGSLAWIDAGGALRVGPQSAGADPGPLAYGKGGTRVTVTDADLVAGVLGPSLLGGRLPLDAGLARTGLEKLAADLRLPLDETVLGVQRVVRSSMAKSMRLILARRGIDPRRSTLLAFGGAGPMHAVSLARDIGARTVVVPFLPGAFSAYGILISPIRLEYGRSVVCPLARAGRILRSTLESLREQAVQDLEDQGLDSGRAHFEASADLRFRGQSYEINVPVWGDLAVAFRREHARIYGYASQSSEPIELVTIRFVARVPRVAKWPRHSANPAIRPGSRRVLFDEGWEETAVYARPSLDSDQEIEGPAIVEEDHATTLVPDGARAHVGRAGLLSIEVGG